MPRPVKWSRDLHSIREKAGQSRTETWSRSDIERLFDVGRVSAQSLMRAMGGVQTIGSSHFVDRGSLLGFLDGMMAAESVEEALRMKLDHAEPAPRPKAVRVLLPGDLRQAMLPDLPANVKLSPGRIEITAKTAAEMTEGLLRLAMIMQNDLGRWQAVIEPPLKVELLDEAMRSMLSHLRVSRG